MSSASGSSCKTSKYLQELFLCEYSAEFPLRPNFLQKQNAWAGNCKANLDFIPGLIVLLKRKKKNSSRWISKQCFPFLLARYLCEEIWMWPALDTIVNDHQLHVFHVTLYLSTCLNTIGPFAIYHKSITITVLRKGKQKFILFHKLALSPTPLEM